jgi:hypothetical protein
MKIPSEFITKKLGPRVLIFDETMDTGKIQKTINAIHRLMEHKEFGEERFCLLFKPGRYNLDVTVDYYTQASGLGKTPGDVIIRGSVQSVTTTKNNNVTIMFWRSAENFTVEPVDRSEPVYWVVSQAAPYRRMHIKGDLVFDRNGWASGGYLGNSIIEGKAGTRSGQQWFTINSRIGQWYGAQWNHSFLSIGITL